MQPLRRLAALGSITLAALGLPPLAGMAWAQTPHPWQMGFQDAHSPVEARIQSLNSLVTVIIVVITVFVAALLGYVIWRFDARKNPTPTRTSHNTVLEVAWTVIPVLILVVIAIPSFSLVYFEDRTHDADLTIKVTGHQWYWEYGYPDQGGLHFDSYMITDDAAKPDGYIRHLSVDNQLVVPAGKNIRVLTTSADVIHSFFIPSLGVQRYAIPGRTIETWFKADEPGTYYGECNQICGENHSGMSIAVHAVTDEEFKTWVTQAKAKFSSASAAPVDAATRVASAQP